MKLIIVTLLMAVLATQASPIENELEALNGELQPMDFFCETLCVFRLLDEVTSTIVGHGDWIQQTRETFQGFNDQRVFCLTLATEILRTGCSTAVNIQQSAAIAILIHETTVRLSHLPTEVTTIIRNFETCRTRCF